MHVNAPPLKERRRVVHCRLFEDVEVTEQPPQQQENEDRAEATASQFLGAPSSSDTPQDLAHRFLTLIVTPITEIGQEGS
jgi:hypothetical protein